MRERWKGLRPILDLRFGDVVEISTPSGETRSTRYARFDRTPDSGVAFYDAHGKILEGIPVDVLGSRSELLRDFEDEEKEHGVCRCRGAGFIASGSDPRSPESIEICGCPAPAVRMTGWYRRAAS